MTGLVMSLTSAFCDEGGGSDIVKRDNVDDVIDDDRDTIIFEASAAFASASNWLDEVGDGSAWHACQ